MPGNRTCQSCDAVVSARDRFCPSCGMEVLATRAVGDETLVTPATGREACPGCGIALSGPSRFCPHCGAPRSEDATVPSMGSLQRITVERLATATSGEFEILERLGQGAMGSVYLARDVALSRRVAIKVISPHLLEDESVIERFRLEAQTVAALRHPNIVNLYGVRQLGDLHYFIMDYIDGPSLRALMKAHAPLEVPVAQALLFQIGSALNYAHHRGRGVIHRDIKPANIMVDREGHAVVMDFGISRVVGEGRSGLTQTGATIGTPEYMSPEQCMDRELTGASDQYALGIVAYEMLTGDVPFRASTYALMMAHASSPPPPLGERRPDCPPEVEAAVMRMLAKAPAERFSDLDAAVKALGGRPLAPGDPVHLRIIELADSVASDTTALDDSSPLSPVPGSRDAATVTIVGLPDIVEPGDRFDLRAQMRRGTGAARPVDDVVWSSSDDAVASVEDGVVTALKPGSASLTATVGSVASTVIVSVRERRSANVSVLPQSVFIESGGTIPLKAEVLDRKGQALPTPVVWSTEDTAVALVAQDGTVTAVAPGSTRIIADADGVQAAAEITVQQAAVHELSISGTPPSVHVGDEITPTVTVSDSLGAALERTVTWHSDQPKVVAIRDGRLVAVATGTATLRAECGGHTAEVQVKVKLAQVAIIAIAGVRDAPRPGERFPLQAVLFDRDGKALVRAVEWSSSDASVASVSDAGVVEVHAEGSFVVRAAAGGASEEVTVNAVGVPPGGVPSTAEQTFDLREQAPSRAGAGTAPPPPAPTIARPGPRPRRRWAPWLGVAALLVVAFGVAQAMGWGPLGTALGPAAGTPPGEDAAGTGQESAQAEPVDAAGDPSGQLPSGGEDGGEQVAGAPPEGAGGGEEAGAGDEGLPVQGGEPTEDTPTQARPQVPTESRPRDPAPAVDEYAVASIRIEGGDRVLSAGERATLAATALNAGGLPVAPPPITWRSSDEAVAAVRNGEVRALGPGRTTITASAAGVRGTIDLTVEGPALEAPTREEALEHVQRIVSLLRARDADAVSRLFGRGEGRGGDADVLARMREANFSARLVRLGEPALTPDGAAVDFDVEVVWRTAQGARMQRNVPLLAAFQPTPDGWRLGGIARRAGRGRAPGGP